MGAESEPVKAVDEVLVAATETVADVAKEEKVSVATSETVAEIPVAATEPAVEAVKEGKVPVASPEPVKAEAEVPVTELDPVKVVDEKLSVPTSKPVKAVDAEVTLAATEPILEVAQNGKAEVPLAEVVAAAESVQSGTEVPVVAPEPVEEKV